MKTKGYEEQRQKTNNKITVALCQKKAGKKTPHIPKMTQFLKGGKNGHFAKAMAKQNGHKWSMLGLSLQKPSTHRNYPLKSLELFYAEDWQSSCKAKWSKKLYFESEPKRAKNIQKMTPMKLKLFYMKIGLKTHITFILMTRF